jgi:anaphase-promoting complex subunit 2
MTQMWKNVASILLNDWVQATLPKVLAEVSEAKLAQETLLATLAGIIRRGGNGVASDAEGLLSRYHTAVSALLLTSAPHHFSEVLNLYFKGQLDEFSKVVKQRNHSPQGSYVTDENADSSNASPDYSSGEDDEMDVALSSHHTSVYADEMDVNGSSHGSRRAMNLNDSDGVRDMELTDYVTNSELKLSVGAASIYEVVTVGGEDWVAGVGSVVNHLRHLGFAAMSEEGYASAIYSLLKVKIHGIANKRYEKPVLGPIRRWIEAVPLRFLSIMLAASGTPSHFTKTSPSTFPSPLTSTPVLASGADKTVTERVIRWRLRLQFFAYETLGDLRINELFDVIVDYPESIAAIEDLRQCLANTGHHAKLVESFRTALRQRLLTAGAATTDILLQYVSTIKALRTMDPTGVVLEAVAEPIKEYLRGRKDTIRCIVTMLTDDTGVSGSSGLGGAGESLFEELSRGVTALENADSDDDGDGDGDEAWAAAERYVPFSFQLCGDHFFQLISSLP